MTRYFITIGLAALISQNALAIPSQDQQIHQIAKTLKPISDEIWMQVAGEQTNQTYEVVKGDTLYDISGRLFGDTKYWPKIWSLNNGKLKNPHVIYPGNLIAFYPGSGSTLPSLGLQTNQKPVLVAKAPKKRSTEWQDLPQQNWEQVSIQLPPEIDPDGFDKRNKIQFSQSVGFNLPALTTSEQIQSLGTITNAKSQYRYLGIGDTLFIESKAGLQIGQIYSVTQEPTELKSEKLDRTGFSYINIASVRVTDYREGIYIAEVIQQSLPILRGNTLIPYVPRVKEPTRVPGHEPLRGTLFVDRNLLSTFETAQHKYVLIDRGSRDGITPGMVFRNYVYSDNFKNKKVLSEDVLKEGDILVVHVSDQFCTGIVEFSLNPIPEKSDVVLLTGLEASTEVKEIQTLENLNRIDPGADLNESEKKDLEQLEGWEGEPLQEEPANSFESEPETTLDPPAEKADEILEFQDTPTEQAPDIIDPPVENSTTSPLPPSSDIDNLDEFELDEPIE